MNCLINKNIGSVCLFEFWKLRRLLLYMFDYLRKMYALYCIDLLFDEMFRILELNLKFKFSFWVGIQKYLNKI